MSWQVLEVACCRWETHTARAVIFSWRPWRCHRIADLPSPTFIMAPWSRFPFPAVTRLSRKC